LSAHLQTKADRLLLLADRFVCDAEHVLISVKSEVCHANRIAKHQKSLEDNKSSVQL